MRKQLLIILLLCGASFLAKAQHVHEKKEMKVACPVCKASGKVERARIAPPEEFLLKSGKAKSQIIVDYKGFPEEPKAAFAYAVSIWESLIESEVPIRMEAKWSSLDENVLGSCGPETHYSNFKNAPYEDRFYAVAIAEKIAKEELNGESRYDMIANFNKNFDWYLGIDMECPDTLYDFVSVVLHEIGHGLGFTGFFYTTGEDAGGYGYNPYGAGAATSFDILVNNNKGNQLVDESFYDNFSVELYNALTSSNLFSDSPVATKINKNIKPRLYAPFEFDGGSSIYHLNDATYPHGNPNSLMTHAVGQAEAIHHPGALTLGIMDDIGWRNLFIHFDPTKDKEQVAPISFETSFESDYGVDTSALFVIYSTDEFQSHSDTLLLKQEEGTERFTADLTPAGTTQQITYYVQASDSMNRVRTSPSNAPKRYHYVTFGPDTELPEITHDEIPYFLKTGDPLMISVNADDNVGIDTVYIEYTINGIEQTPFGLSLTEEHIYSGLFSVNIEDVQDGDFIEYTIFARDSSAAKNSAQLPLGDEKFSFYIEEIFEPVTTYTSDFNGETSDFIEYDFSVNGLKGFDNGALHSRHPYGSSGIDNQFFDLTAFLKRPIILKEGGTMSFDEVVLVEPGEPESVYGDEDFWDYVIVEASKDLGVSWNYISEGYDSGEEVSWAQAYREEIVDQVSTAVGSSELYVNREIDLLASGNFHAGDTVVFRFRLHSDPYAHGWGWAIDNLIIQQTVSARVVSAENNVKVYPNPFNDVLNVSMSSVENNSEIEIEVFDLFGKKVHGQKFENVQGQLNETLQLNGLGNGMYVVHVTENGKSIRAKKLIKN